MYNLIITDDFTTILLKEGINNLEFRTITREECADMINDAVKDDGINLISIKVEHDETTGIAEIDFKYIEQEFPNIDNLKTKLKKAGGLVFNKEDRIIVTENYDKKELSTRYWLVKYI